MFSCFDGVMVIVQINAASFIVKLPVQVVRANVSSLMAWTGRFTMTKAAQTDCFAMKMQGR